ncbi:MAG: hypothetical protein U0946_03985, partial [Patescibacteria group bacterium]|nr:hypothetical protein [Patescibacteria group bacterium]
VGLEVNFVISPVTIEWVRHNISLKFVSGFGACCNPLSTHFEQTISGVANIMPLNYTPSGL